MVPQADVLIVTATQVESLAVIDAFAKLTGQPARPVPVGDRIYHYLGEVHDAHVFLALTEMGSGGLGASQQTVQKGIASLRPAAVILVGIAFGVDKQKQAIGDVLVSHQLLLYELQRVGEGKIVPRGDKPHASPRLFNYLKSAQLYWNEPAIAIRFGLILSGEKLVDSLDYREQLQQFGQEVIGGEMEGAGLYVACQDVKVDWILVKAICDWADGNKAYDKDNRQQLAARNAATFVAHALQHVAMKQSESTVEHKQKNDIREEGKKLIKNIKSTTPKDIIHECLYESFENASDFFGFCRYFFEDLYKEMRETDGFKMNIRRLIQYCKTHREEDYLWSCIQKERINLYNIYYPKWKLVIEDQQPQQEGIDSIDQYKHRTIIPEKPLSPDGEGQVHPLSGNNHTAINEWFFNELELHEKSQVLTVALFEGINRKFIEPISQKIERIFFEKI
jgi:nucleoside phosphorylase